MKRKTVLSLLCLISLVSLASPALAAPPFGQFGGKVGGGNSGAGIMALHGWALDDGGVASVDVLVDGIVAGRATYGRSRPAVAVAYPGFPNAATAGFAFQLDTTHYLNGNHMISARVRSLSGEVVDLKGKRFEFLNTTHNLAPFGTIEFPNQNAELNGICSTLSAPRRYNVVSGYVLDAGVQEDDTGVGYVELLIDRSLVYNTKTSCFFSSVTGGQTNCYGLRRLDIERIFPSLPDSIHSGFRFVLDIGELLAGGYRPGHHTLTLRSGDRFGTVRTFAEIPVTFSCVEFLPDDLSLGFIDVPLEGLLYKGTVTTTGWALDFQGVSSVTIVVDGTPVGFAELGFARPGITASYPGFPQSGAPGWRFLLDTTRLSNGEHFLQAIVNDPLFHETLIGERRFVVANP